MTRQEKIQFLKDVQSGNFERLNEIKREERLNDVYNEYFYPCFFYLCEIENENDCNWKHVFKIERFAEIKQAMGSFEPLMGFEGLTDFTFDAIFHIFSFLESMDKNNSIGKLDPYKKNYSEKVKAFQYGNNPAIKPGNFKEIYGWESLI